MYELEENETGLVCSFFGHRDIVVTEQLKEKVHEIVEDLILNKNFTIFLFGGFGDFDDVCCDIVNELKIKYPFISRVFCLHDQRALDPSRRRRWYPWIKEEKYDEIIYIPLKFDYYYTSIYFRNVEMINISSMVLFYVTEKERSGVYKAYKHALKKKKPIINLYGI